MVRDNVLILGGGRTGIAMNRFLSVNFINHEWIADTRLIREPLEYVVKFSQVVASPAIDARDPVIKACATAKIPVYSELNFAAERIPCPIAAVTGTNGKTTVTRLLYDMLSESGRDVFLAGNGGVPLSSVLGQITPRAVVAVEVSSFMLEFAPTFHARACCITNLSSDHLNRHGSMEEYAKVKAKIYAHAESGDSVVLNADDEFVLPRVPVMPKYFSINKPCDAYLDGEELILNGRRLLSRSELKLKGEHNVANVLCAALMADSMGVKPFEIQTAAAAFTGIAHRIEYVGVNGSGVRFYNDSKATNVDSTVAALSAFTEPLVLILGGSSKGECFDRLLSALPQNCEHVIATGATASEIVDAAYRCQEQRVTVVVDFFEAVSVAADYAQPGGVVLLSPACASFDCFKDYRDRGDRYSEYLYSMGVKR